MPPKRDREQFIHDDLLKIAKELVRALRQTWKKEGTLASIAIAWPGERLRLDDGYSTEGCIFTSLEKIPEEGRKAVLTDFTKKTHAFGLFVVEYRPSEGVLARFETSRHSRAWRLQIEKHGDVRRLGAIQEETSYLGILRKLPD